MPTCEGETFVLSCGHRSAQPLVLLHGGLTNSSMWFRSLPTWAQYFRVHAVDVIGDPGFSSPSRPKLSNDAHARWLDDVWRAVDLQKAFMVGASLGGFLALDYALRRPDRVRKLALIAPAGLASVRTSALAKQLLLCMLGSKGRYRARMIAFGLREEGLTEESRKFLEFVEMVQTSVLGRARLPAAVPDDRLRRLRSTTLIMLGGRDVFFDSAAVKERIRRIVPQARIEWFPEAGHAVVDATDVVSDFLRQPTAP